MDLVELGALEGVVEPLGQRLDRRQVVHAPRDLLHCRHRRVLQVQSDKKIRQDHGLTQSEEINRMIPRFNFKYRVAHLLMD